MISTSPRKSRSRTRKNRRGRSNFHASYLLICINKHNFVCVTEARSVTHRQQPERCKIHYPFLFAQRAVSNWTLFVTVVPFISCWNMLNHDPVGELYRDLLPMLICRFASRGIRQCEISSGAGRFICHISRIARFVANRKSTLALLYWMLYETVPPSIELHIYIYTMKYASLAYADFG